MLAEIKMEKFKFLDQAFSNIYNGDFSKKFMQNTKLFMLAFILIISIEGIYAQENETANQTSENVSAPAQKILLTNFMPKEVKIGDVQFNVQIENNQNETAENIFAFITGKGFSSYDITPISSLEPGEKDYVFVFGNLKEEGEINLTIKIGNEVFYQVIAVINPNSGDQSKLEEIQKAQEKEQQIKNISDQLDTLKENFAILENELIDKTDDNYDVSHVSLSDLKGYIKAIQIDISTGNVNDANLNLNFAYEEYSTQRTRLDNAEKIPIVNRLRNNIIIFTTFAGAILTFFALYELLKKKKENIAEISKKIIHKKEIKNFQVSGRKKKKK